MSTVQDTATPAPARDRLADLSDGAVRWIGRNLEFFDPFSPSSPLPPERRAKAALELAIFCHCWARRKPPTEVSERAGALLRRTWARPEFPRLFETHGGGYAGAQRLVYAALAPAGVREDLREAVLAQVEADGYLVPGTKSPYLRLETRYYADKANAAHGIEPYRELAARSLLTELPEPPVSLVDAYTMTHTAFYLTDYGYCHPDLPDGVRERARRFTYSMIASCARQNLWDLTGELVITARCLGGRPAATPAGQTGIRCLAAAQQEDGAIPGRSAAGRARASLEPAEFFRKAYHTTLVAALMSLIVG